jgi:type VI secretion system protein ImpC
MPGGEPFCLLVGDYEFSYKAEDMALLTNISRVAAAAHAPFVGAASPAMFGMSTFEPLRRLSDLAMIFESPAHQAWTSFRDSEDSRYVALTLPRVLGRLPYGPATVPVNRFEFEEYTGGSGRDHWLWMSAAWAFAERVAHAMARYGWPAMIRGVEGGGRVDGLPALRASPEGWDVADKSPTEVLIHERREYELAGLGFLPLCGFKYTDHAGFFSLQSCQKPRKYADSTASAAAAIASRLDAVLCVSRFIHYIKVMCRDRVGSYMSRTEKECWLNSWVQNYVISDDSASQQTRAEHPLREARIEVVEDPHRAGADRVIAYIRLHMQGGELPAFCLRGVTELQ